MADQSLNHARPQLPYVDPYAPDDLPADEARMRLPVTTVAQNMMHDYLNQPAVLQALQNLRIASLPEDNNNNNNNNKNTSGVRTRLTPQSNNAATAHRDPLSSIGPPESQLRQLIQNHVYIVETLVYLMPYALVDPSKRTYMTLTRLWHYFGQAGLIADTPSLETLPVDVDNSFQFTNNTTVPSIIATYRYSEDWTPRTDDAEEELIDVDKLGDAELTALIEERIYCRVTLHVHSEDVNIIVDALRKHQISDGSNATMVKNTWTARNQAIKQARIQFVDFRLLVR